MKKLMRRDGTDVWIDGPRGEGWTGPDFLTHEGTDYALWHTYLGYGVYCEVIY